MAQIEFTAFPRTAEGRGASRRLRRSGKAPGIVYGGTAQPTPVEVDHNALIHALKNEAFHASILTMKLDGGTQKVLLRDVQMHPFRHEVLHVDFQRVDENKKIHMKVPLHFTRESESPAVKLQGALISHIANEVDVLCLPRDLPEFIEVDLSKIESGKSVHVSEIALPPGVTAVVHAGKDPVVAIAAQPKAHAEAEEAAAAEGAPAAAAPAAAAPAADAKAAEPKKDAGKDDKKK